MRCVHQSQKYDSLKLKQDLLSSREYNFLIISMFKFAELQSIILTENMINQNAMRCFLPKSEINWNDHY